MSPLDHDEARGIASQALDGSLDRPQEQELAVHLVSCPACKMFHDNLERARRAVREGLARAPSPEVLDAAVHRATTVLRGDADPGPPLTTVEGPAPTDAETVPPSYEDFAPRDEEPGPPVGGPGTPAPAATPDTGEPSPDEDLFFDIEGTEVDEEPPPPGEPEEGLPAEPGPEPPPTPPGPGPAGTEVGPTESTPAEPMGPVGEEPPTVPVAGPPEEPTEPPPPESPEGPPVQSPPTGEAPEGAPSVEELAVEPRPDTEEGPREGPPPPREAGLRWRAGPTAVAILATVAVAVLAAILVLNRGGGEEEPAGDLPSVEEVREGMGAVFDDMTSLETSYSITRLSLYRIRTEEGRIVYSFSNAEQTGRIVFEDPLRLRQERTLEVPESRAVRSTIVRTPEELRMLRQDGEEETATAVANYPLGPPEGRLVPKLGILEEAIGSVARMAQDSRELEVIGWEQLDEDGFQAIRVAFPVAAEPFTRTDRIEALLDPQSFLPLRVTRTLSREDAAVLGPPEILSEDAIEAAFGDRDRITTELATLENVTLNDVVLPGEFVLDLPSEVTPEPSDGGFDHDVSRAEIPSLLPFTPLMPTELSTGFREQSIAVSTGDPTAWGPDDTYPAPSGILETTYSDGKTTIVLSQREQPEGPFELERSPLAEVGEPVTTRTFVRSGIQLTYAISPEIPPHVYGFVGDVFVLVSGYAPQEDLVRIASSLEEAPEVGDTDEEGIVPTETPELTEE